MEIDQIYDNCYTVYNNNLENTEVKEKIEKVLFEVDEIYWNAQSEMYDKLLEIEKIAWYVFLDDNKKRKCNALKHNGKSLDR